MNKESKAVKILYFGGTHNHYLIYNGETKKCGRWGINNLWEDHLLKRGKDVPVANQPIFIRDREEKITRLKNLMFTGIMI